MWINKQIVVRVDAKQYKMFGEEVAFGIWGSGHIKYFNTSEDTVFLALVWTNHESTYVNRCHKDDSFSISKLSQHEISGPEASEPLDFEKNSLSVSLFHTFLLSWTKSEIKEPGQD